MLNIYYITRWAIDTYFGNKPVFEFWAAVFDTYSFFSQLCVFHRVWRNPIPKDTYLHWHRFVSGKQMKSAVQVQVKSCLFGFSSLMFFVYTLIVLLGLSHWSPTVGYGSLYLLSAFVSSDEHRYSVIHIQQVSLYFIVLWWLLQYGSCVWSARVDVRFVI